MNVLDFTEDNLKVLNDNLERHIFLSLVHSDNNNESLRGLSKELGFSNVKLLAIYKNASNKVRNDLLWKKEVKDNNYYNSSYEDGYLSLDRIANHLNIEPHKLKRLLEDYVANFTSNDNTLAKLYFFSKEAKKKRVVEILNSRVKGYTPVLEPISGEYEALEDNEFLKEVKEVVSKYNERYNYTHKKTI